MSEHLTCYAAYALQTETTNHPQSEVWISQWRLLCDGRVYCQKDFSNATLGKWLLSQ